ADWCKTVQGNRVCEAEARKLLAKARISVRRNPLKSDSRFESDSQDEDQEWSSKPVDHDADAKGDDRQQKKRGPGAEQDRRKPKPFSRDRKSGRRKRKQRRDHAGRERGCDVEPSRIAGIRQRVEGELIAVREPVDFQRGDDDDRDAEDKGMDALKR
ncbi:MAG: hypothetical protein K8F62_08520, partial [Pseudorhodoplanes sp.]|nr:hypothetical protein [Pseudorhodoplanes sp.]